MFILILISLKGFHSRNMIYGSITPENILIDDDGRLYLADYGSAMLRKYFNQPFEITTL